VAEPASVYFKWRCPGLIPGFFFSSPPFFGKLPRVNTRGFFFPPFFSGLPRVNTRVFFSRPFPTGCLGLIPGFFFSPFSGELPRVNTRVFSFFFFLSALFWQVRYVGKYVLPYPYLILLIIPWTDGFEFFKYTEPMGM
jgi:hypothetical protein